jgi:hypothetical protein
VGTNAERIVMAWLEENPNVVGVRDLRDLRVMREADVDLSILLMDGRVALAEVKSDYHLGVSGNILFEMLRVNHTAPAVACARLGWSAKTPALWVLFYAPQVESIYVISTEDYRKGFQTYTKETREKSRIVWTNTDAIKSTINLLVPERYFKTAIHRLDTAQIELAGYTSD